MITSMRRCVACDDLWPWPISSRSFGLDLENRVRFVASTVLDGFFSYVAQMIVINRGCVACYVFFIIGKFEFLANFWNFSALTLKKKSSVLNWFFPYLAQMITSKRRCVAYNDLWPWPISSRSFGLGLENRVRSVASTFLDRFFPYLIQMITSMRRCVACDDLWPWPISSRSFGLEFENRVRSVTFSVLDRLFPYLPQIITAIRGCVACYVYKIFFPKFQIFANFSNFLAFTLKKKSTILLALFPYLAQIIITIRGCVACNDLWPWPIFSRSFGLDLENRFHSVASTLLDGFFPYLVQMITSMRRCVACDDLWPWPISSRSFDLDSVASTLLDGFFPYLVQMITSMRRCVACDDLWPWPISSRSFDLDFENRVRSVTFSVVHRLFPYLPQIITTIRGCVAGAGGILDDSIVWSI